MPPAFASPVPPTTARWKPCATHTEIGFTPPGKYGPTGDASSTNSATRDGRTASHPSDPNSRGRRYRLDPSVVGTHARSARTTPSVAARKSASGSSGSAMRAADARKRRAFSTGRMRRTTPSTPRYALKPSNTCWP